MAMATAAFVGIVTILALALVILTTLPASVSASVRAVVASVTIGAD